MGGAHGLTEALHLDGDSFLHRAAPQCKLAATFLFVLAVVTTPREAFWAYGLDAIVLATIAVAARLPLLVIARRLVIEVPFLIFAFFLPIVGQGERVDVLGVSLSVAGLWSAWNIIIKGTLGVAASVILAATTPMADILRGLTRLRVPGVFVSICGFMVRYADVVSGEMRRMRIARISRGHDPRWLWQARAVAATAGALFIRSYERGERVYLAMVSRGYDGAMPLDAGRSAGTRTWAAAMVPATIAAAASALAWWGVGR